MGGYRQTFCRKKAFWEYNTSFFRDLLQTNKQTNLKIVRLTYTENDHLSRLHGEQNKGKRINTPTTFCQNIYCLISLSLIAQTKTDAQHSYYGP